MAAKPRFVDQLGSVPSRDLAVRRADMEGEFSNLLKQMVLSAALVELGRAMFEDAWDKRVVQAPAIAEKFEIEKSRIEKEIRRLIAGRLSDCSKGGFKPRRQPCLSSCYSRFGTDGTEWRAAPGEDETTSTQQPSFNRLTSGGLR